jgi:hypothetical protein
MNTNPAVKNKHAAGYETLAWKWMRYSGILLIPWSGSVLIQDILVGGHRIDLDYVALRWSLSAGGSTISVCWLCIAHGIDGLRQVHSIIPFKKISPVDGLGPAGCLMNHIGHRSRGDHRRSKIGKMR